MIDVNKFTDGRFPRRPVVAVVRGPGPVRRYVRHLRNRA